MRVDENKYVCQLHYLRLYKANKVNLRMARYKNPGPCFYCQQDNSLLSQPTASELRSEKDKWAEEISTRLKALDADFTVSPERIVIIRSSLLHSDVLWFDNHTRIFRHNDVWQVEMK